MIEHHLQKDILNKLVTSPSVRYADLKPDDLDGNIFTYHLKQLVSHKYVAKNPDGTYSLTPEGKAIGINLKLTSKELLEQAHSIFLIAARDTNGRWLLRRRLAQPMYGKWGFVHGEPDARQNLEASANHALKRRTGLTAKYTPRGAGYVKILDGDELESFVHFTLLEAYDISGKLEPASGNGENAWVENPDFTSVDMVPSMNDLVKLLAQSPDFFFAELEYNL